MKNPSVDERNSKQLAFMIIVSLLMTIIMRGVTVRFDVPHVLYIACAVIFGAIALIGYISFIYLKMFKPTGSDMQTDMIKIVALGVAVFFTVSFSVSVIINL